MLSTGEVLGVLRAVSKSSRVRLVIENNARRAEGWREKLGEFENAVRVLGK